MTAALCGIGDEAGRDLTTQLAAITALGWRRLELRTVGGVALADLPPGDVARLADTLDAHGVTVPCVASRIGDYARPVTGDPALDLDELETLAARCARLGTRLIRVMSFADGGLPDARWGSAAIDRLATLARRAAAHGLTLVHENCTGWAARDPSRMRELLDRVPGLRLLFDLGNGVPYGYDAPALLREVVPFVAHVHVKDAVSAPGGVRYVPPGDGEAGVAECLRLLAGSGYDGVLSIEPHIGLRPHTGETAPDAELTAGFLAAGRALEALLSRLPQPVPARESGPPSAREPQPATESQPRTAGPPEPPSSGTREAPAARLPEESVA
ncbi:sugar phosphate isomerase/epimerase family protein [Catenuloplanes japonicus]|uniref:sugar phosphate isomerase/epimerase family protein n=1 Tax=Catenuloplanes japonicus TaxID=33876 RepID=UPI0007C579A9|nr:sugar phosphate isomerase/epimerase family protein [Catenuloplanes japonicus]